jgi:hypothetical protein
MTTFAITIEGMPAQDAVDWSQVVWPPSLEREVPPNGETTRNDADDMSAPEEYPFLFSPAEIVSGEGSGSLVTRVGPWAGPPTCIARTPLGQRLMALRESAIAAGMRLMSEDEILEEVARRRGELQSNDTDLP